MHLAVSGGVFLGLLSLLSFPSYSLSHLCSVSAELELRWNKLGNGELIQIFVFPLSHIILLLHLYCRQ